MRSIITIGGATQDMYLAVDDFTLSTQTKNEALDLSYHIGGGATNTAISFARQGFSPSICAMVGQDHAGVLVAQKLQEAGVDTSALLTHDTAPTGTSVIMRTPNGESAITAYRGANSLLCAKVLPLPFITAHRFLYITSLSSGAAQLLPTLVQAARQNSQLIACNPGASQLTTESIPALLEALPHIDILLLNMAEAIKCARSLKLTIEQLPAFLLNAGPNIVCLTDGPNGVYAHTADARHHAPTLATNIVDTVGAGDAFGSGFVGALLRDADIQTAIAAGLRNSASVIAQVGSQAGLRRNNQ